MNREIKFRGKRIKNAEWITGSLFTRNTEAWIFTGDDIDCFDGECSMWVDVDSEVVLKTVGQYTGLKDKKSKEIYDGDILKTPRGFIGQVVFGRAEEKCRHKEHGVIVIDRYTTYGWIFVRGDGYKCAIDDELLEGVVIGNIYDNPELIKQ